VCHHFMRVTILCMSPEHCHVLCRVSRTAAYMETTAHTQAHISTAPATVLLVPEMPVTGAEFRGGHQIARAKATLSLRRCLC
jgi:hypothetical protein